MFLPCLNLSIKAETSFNGLSSVVCSLLITKKLLVKRPLNASTLLTRIQFQSSPSSSHSKMPWLRKRNSSPSTREALWQLQIKVSVNLTSVLPCLIARASLLVKASLAQCTLWIHALASLPLKQWTMMLWIVSPNKLSSVRAMNLLRNSTSCDLEWVLLTIRMCRTRNSTTLAVLQTIWLLLLSVSANKLLQTSAIDKLPVDSPPQPFPTVRALLLLTTSRLATTHPVWVNMRNAIASLRMNRNLWNSFLS